MLTAHAMNPDTLMVSTQKGALSTIPKQTMVKLDLLLNNLPGACERDAPLENDVQ
jgi:hypothetical protein